MQPHAASEDASLFDALVTPCALLAANGAVLRGNSALEDLIAVMGNNPLHGSEFAQWFDQTQGVREAIAQCCAAQQPTSVTLDVGLRVAPTASPALRRNAALPAQLTLVRHRAGVLAQLRPQMHSAADQHERNKELLRNLAHEIKNPLGGVRGAAQLLQLELRDEGADKAKIEYTQVIIHEADRLKDLVDRLLLPLRQPHTTTLVNIHEICERVRQVVLVEFPRGMTFVRDYDVSIPEFWADREQLIQTLLNLAHNACAAMEPLIAQARAQLIFRTRVLHRAQIASRGTLTHHKLALQLQVMDNGCGIAEGLQERIFYPLVSGREGGCGLGLALVQDFVQQHGGVVQCQSTAGATMFEIVLPLRLQSQA